MSVFGQTLAKFQDRYGCLREFKDLVIQISSKMSRYCSIDLSEKKSLKMIYMMYFRTNEDTILKTFQIYSARRDCSFADVLI